MNPPTQIKTVALAGATGNLGAPILSALLSSKRFTITVLAREGSTPTSTTTLPPGVKVAHVNYDSLPSLQTALQNQDAVISTLGSTAIASQKLLVAAAAAAGVKRFLPSEFGSDTLNPRAAALPVYAQKLEVQEYLRQKCQESGMSYTLVLNSAFLDWGIRVGFLIDLKGKRLVRYDGGERGFSATRLETVGRAVVGVLERLEETQDRAVRVQDVQITQNQLLGMAKRAVGGDGWTVEDKRTEETEREAYEMLGSGKGELIVGAMMGFLASAIYKEGYGGKFEKTDNELLGIEGMSEGEVEELIREIAAEKE